MSMVNDAAIMVAVAEAQHFGKAAERCHLSPSAMTRAVQRLEKNVGVPLFERDNRSVQLTPQGEAYLRFCRNMLSEWDLLQANLSAADNHLRGELSVYCSVTAVYSLLEPLVSACRREHPGIELRLHTGDQADAVQRVLEHREQVAIAACPASLPDSLEFLPLTQTPFVLIQPVNPVDGLHEVLSASETHLWANVPVILAERGIGRERMEGWFKQLKQRPKIYANVSGHEAIVSMVALGFGVGGVPQIVVDSSPHKPRVAPMASPHALAPLDVGLICHKRHKQNAIVSAFWQVAAALNIE